VKGELYSPVANVWTFDQEEVICRSTEKEKFYKECEIIGQIGEGSFGKAFKVRSKRDGKLYAVKQSKNKYLGYRDREVKVEEVKKALTISN
jgi:hypothetical protein